MGLCHFDGRGGGRIEGRAGFQQADNLGAAIAGALDDRLQPVLRRPAHIDQVRQRNPPHGGIARQRHHCIAMPAQNKGRHIAHGHAEFQAQEMAEAGRVEHASHTDHAVCRQARILLQRPDHCIQRVGDADDEGVRRVLPDAFADRLHHFQVDAQQIVAAHPRLARHACGDDADIGAAQKGIVVGAGHLGVEPGRGAGLRDIQRLALRCPFGDVEKHDVAEFLDRGKMRERAADLSCADQCNLGSGHCSVLRVGLYDGGWVVSWGASRKYAALQRRSGLSPWPCLR